MKHSKRGFTLLELLVVLAIIGILAAVAIPYYNTYVVRARLVEVEHAMAVIKTAVTTYYQDNGGTFPRCPNISAIQNSLGIGLRAISTGAARRVSGNTGLRVMSNAANMGCIRATILASVLKTPNNCWMQLRPIPGGDGSLDWVWEYQATFPLKFRNRSTQ